MRTRPQPSVPAGFTLVEVMVALAVVALALPALLFTLSQHIDGAAYLRDKSLAQVVASNRLAELRLVSAAQRKLFSGKDSGEVEVAERAFYWWVESSKTEVDNFQRIEISVALDEADETEPLYKLVAFMSANIEEQPLEEGGDNPGAGSGQGGEGDGSGPDPRDDDDDS